MNIVKIFTIIFFLYYAPYGCADNFYKIPFNFLDEKSQPLNLSTFSGQISVITFAFANCRKVCVESLHVMERLQKEATAANKTVNFIVISYDPLNDTPGDWAEYRLHHNIGYSNWFFLTGTIENTHELAHTLGFDYWLYDEHIMHDFKITLLNEQGAVSKTMDWNNRNDHWF